MSGTSEAKKAPFREQSRLENEYLLREGLRLLSAYQGGNGTTFWVITEADRSGSTVLLPEEY
jgi:hypothetical protein